MPVLTHYIDLRCVPMDAPDNPRADVAFLLGKVMDAVHVFNVGNGNPLAVALPGMRMETSEGKPPFPGDTVRVFSDSQSLSAFIASERLDVLAKGGAFGSALEVRPVVQASGFVAYRRTRGAEKGSPGRALRSERRLLRMIASGKAKGTVTEEQLAERRRKMTKPTRHVMPPYVNMRSYSTDSTFKLFIEQVDSASGGEGMFSTYGLSVNGSAVPKF